MPDLIILRLYPIKPTSAASFTNFLAGLTIDAFDLTFADSVDGVPIGSASGLADPHTPIPPNAVNNTVNIVNTSIIQHYRDSFDPVTTITTRSLEAAATAVIVVSPPPGHTEYPSASSFDIGLEISRGTLEIINRTIHFNVPFTTVGALSNNQTAYFGMAASAYLALPSSNLGSDPNLGFVDLPPNGQPPSFDSLMVAINKVLALDPDAGANIVNSAPLTIAESRQVASEIVWNRVLYPPPEPARSLGELYTRPPLDSGADVDEIETDRKQFEAEMAGYQGTHEAEALRLSGFVFAASAAVACEALTTQADRAGLDFPLITGPLTGTEIPDATVILTRAGGLLPPFTVPARYFYALGAMLPPQISPEQRLNMARLQDEERLLIEIQTAVDEGIIDVPAGPAPNPDQAARRLRALGSTIGPAPEVQLVAPITTLVTDWLDHTGPTSNIESAFWQGKAGSAGYRELVLRVVTRNHTPLITAIKGPPHNVVTVAGLVAITDQEWRDFFLGPSPPPGPPPRTSLLPPFTQPGTPAERVEAFIRHLRKFFAVPFSGPPPVALNLSGPPSLPLSIADIFTDFTAAYAAHGGGVFQFGSPFNAAAMQQAIFDVFPGDPDAQAWLLQALQTIDALFLMTDLGAALQELQFSSMEALFARGFVDAQSVQALSLAEFQEALIGTVAYFHAPAIYTKAGGVGAPAGPVDAGFEPVNPDGSLTDCIPPPHLSPLGPVEYLAEMLRVAANSTCEDPFPRAVQSSLSTILVGRRGPLGDLHATRPNLQTPLPMIDLVNESLESLTDGLPAATGGAVYDTAGDQLAGHLLDDGSGTLSTPIQFAHVPQTIFASLPEHSSPAVPVEKPGAYDDLKIDFTAPLLPYPQPLDINRSYLLHLKTTRFATMRRFRKDITEFVIDPNNEPAGFQRHLWRYPVRFDIAREYLGISTEEYDLLYGKDIVEAAAPGSLLLREVFGFPADLIDGVASSNIVLSVPEFLERMGLTYCEFIDLWRSEFVIFHREGLDRNFPECQPCCPDNLRIVFESGQNVLIALRKLAVFIRLWRRLQEVPGPKITFNQLRDISDVLHLFNGDTINPDFIRQLVALMMLRDFLRLPLFDKDDPIAPGATGAERTHLLAIWVGTAANKWEWALALLLDHVQDYAEVRYEHLRRQPETIKIITENLDLLARLSGFDPNTATDTWHADPTNTLRFIEILTKIYSSNFTVGEIILLFTAETHLAGDDPFLLTDPAEALEAPLNLPEDDEYNLLALRQKLLDVEVSDEDADAWSWPKIETTLRDEFGFAVPPGPDPLNSLGEHFFPSVLEISGHHVPVNNRQYRVNLPSVSTSPLMWNTPPDGPFRYDSAAEQLWTHVPLNDGAVVKALQEMRPLTNIEQNAVRDLYFSPRVDLATFSFLFANFSEAIDRLVQENDEAARWSYFRREFARSYARCRIVAEHLAAHVAAVTDHERWDGYRVAWKVLRHLYADENFALTPWEDDSGVPPAVTWGPQPNGGAFAALLALTGTGLLTEFMVQKAALAWRQVGDPLSGFGETRNEFNTPVPTVLPSMGLTLTPEQQRFVVARNGFALRDVNGEPLGGAQRFSVRWTGALLVENGGRYSFHAGAPTAEGLDPDFKAADDYRWRLTLRRGQKSWIVLNRQWPGENAPDAHSDPLGLRPGVYQIVVELEQREPTFARDEEICPRHCGFQIKYKGPDTSDALQTVPLKRLYRDQKTATLGHTLDVGGMGQQFLEQHYTSTLRDMRRTYQRAFKAVLFAHRLRLSATPIPNDRQSELGYMLDHGGVFLGTSYPRTGPAAFDTHHAHFNFNFLPVTDPYRSPPVAADDRQHPSNRRQAALFDWWERLWDYSVMRRETRPARERPAWLLFYEASERQPDDPPQLVRHLGVDIRHAHLVLNYFGMPASYLVTTPDLEDERWAVRIWQGEKWIRKLRRNFFEEWIGAARPHLWASDDPSVEFGLPLVSGNANLTKFIQDGYFENNDPRRYQDLTLLNDGLRDRARDALLAYLCRMDRVALPWGGHAEVSRDMSDLLLQDVEVGTCQRASRIEEAITAVQTFIQRARLGLEPGFVVTPAFALLWDRHFATFYTWQICKRHEIYRENFIDLEELQKARKTEAFQFLEHELRRATLTVPIPGGLEYWPGFRPPIYPGLTVLQAREPSEIQFLTPGPLPEGLDLMGTPESDARPSWLAPIHREGRRTRDGEEPSGENRDDDVGGRDVPPPTGDATAPPRVRALSVVADGTRLTPDDLAKLPLWIQAAIRLGVRFIRVAAARTPPASTNFSPRHVGPEGCCVDCGRVHPALIDEYYFWLQDSRYFDAIAQNAELGAEAPDDPTNDTTSDWHRAVKVPTALNWDSDPMVHLFWCRFHNGEFWQPRRSDEGVRIDPAGLAGQLPQLDFKGRVVDSLRFEVTGGVAPPGFGEPSLPNFDPTPSGFRYDMATDSAVVLPLLVAPPAPVAAFPGGLNVYPFFAYFSPGAHLEPPSMYSVGLTVGASLRAHCRFEAALKWYELAYKPLKHDNTWAQCGDVPRTPTDIPERPDTPNETPGTITDGVVLLIAQPAIKDEIPCCPTAPVNDDVAKKRAVLLHYLETLLRWGDALMCRNSPEVFQQATVIFNTMRLLLGFHPARIYAKDDVDPMEPRHLPPTSTCFESPAARTL